MMSHFSGKNHLGIYCNRKASVLFARMNELQRLFHYFLDITISYFLLLILILKNFSINILHDFNSLIFLLKILNFIVSMYA